MKRPLVLLTRPVKQNEDIIPEINAIGCDIISEPMLKIIALKPMNININKQTGLIFTSVRAVENFIIKDQETLLCPIYTIGNKTAEQLIKKGFSNVVYRAKSSKEMQHYFDSNTDTIQKEIMHICGKHIVTQFIVHSNKVKKHTVYKAEKTGKFTESLLLSVQNISIIIFYSARSAENFVKLIKDYELTEKCASITILCISTRTAKQTKDVHWNNIYIAQKPNHRSMMDMLQNILKI